MSDRLHEILDQIQYHEDQADFHGTEARKLRNKILAAMEKQGKKQLVKEVNGQKVTITAVHPVSISYDLKGLRDMVARKVPIMFATKIFRRVVQDQFDETELNLALERGDISIADIAPFSKQTARTAYVKMTYSAK